MVIAKLRLVVPEKIKDVVSPKITVQGYYFTEYRLNVSCEILPSGNEPVMVHVMVPPISTGVLGQATLKFTFEESFYVKSRKISDLSKNL